MSPSRARWLAPLALAACATAVAVIVLSESGSEAGPDAAVEEASTTETTTRTVADSDGRRFYRIKPGDVLSAIAEETGVPTETLLELNPDIDPNALRPGQRLRLSR